MGKRFIKLLIDVKRLTPACRKIIGSREFCAKAYQDILAHTARNGMDRTGQYTKCQGSLAFGTQLLAHCGNPSYFLKCKMSLAYHHIQYCAQKEAQLMTLDSHVFFVGEWGYVGGIENV